MNECRKMKCDFFFLDNDLNEQQPSAHIQVVGPRIIDYSFFTKRLADGCEVCGKELSMIFKNYNLFAK